MNKFIITQNYGQGTYGYLYFDSAETDIEKLKSIAIETVREEWYKRREMRFILHSPSPCRPTLKVAQYNPQTQKAVRGGLKFTARWR